MKQSLSRYILYFCELTEISEILHQILLHFGDIKQVRWLFSKEGAVKTMLLNYEVVVSHLEHDFVTESRADDSNKLKSSTMTSHLSNFGSL